MPEYVLSFVRVIAASVQAMVGWDRRRLVCGRLGNEPRTRIIEQAGPENPSADCHSTSIQLQSDRW